MPGSVRIPREAMVGDPFLGGLGRALGRAAKVIGRGVGKGLKLGAQVVFGTSPGGQQAMQAATVPMFHTPRGSYGSAPAGVRTPPPLPPAPSSAIVQSAQRAGAPASARIQTFPASVYATGVRRRYRRMNVLNLRALKRGLRRVKGFEKIASKILRRTAPHHRFKPHFRARRKR